MMMHYYAWPIAIVAAGCTAVITWLTSKHIHKEHHSGKPTYLLMLFLLVFAVVMVIAPFFIWQY